MRYEPVDNEVLTVAETADLLKLSQYTVRDLARKGELPGRKIGREWRFVRGEVMDLVRGTPPGATLPRGYDLEPLSTEDIAQLDAAWAAYRSGADPGTPLEEIIKWFEDRRAARARSGSLGRE